MHADDLRPERDDVIDVLSSLVPIDSVNPSLVPGSAGEGEIARSIADWLRREGIEATAPEVVPGRPNVIGTVRGAGSGRTLMLNAHIDTVGVAGVNDPFAPRIDGDRLYGRGAYDMKGSMAAIMLAARALSQVPEFRGQVLVTGVMDEEYASLGTQAVIQTLQADAAIVTEPTALRVCAAHRGFAWFALETRGRAAHGSKPEFGVDAIARMGRVLAGMDRLSREIADRQPHPLLDRGSIHASLIEGGQELSSYPERCRLQVERRTVPGDTPESVRAEIDAMVSQAGDGTELAATSELLLWRDPFEVDPNAEIVQTVLRQTESVTGIPVPIVGDTPWMDAALLQAAGIPSVVFGPGGAGAHAVDEWVSIDQVAVCAEVLTRTAIEFCGAS